MTRFGFVYKLIDGRMELILRQKATIRLLIERAIPFITKAVHGLSQIADVRIGTGLLFPHHVFINEFFHVLLLSVPAL